MPSINAHSLRSVYAHWLFINLHPAYRFLWFELVWCPPQAFNKCKREGFRLQTVDKAPLAKRRKMKKTSTSTETRSSSSESTHSSTSSSQSQEKTPPEPSVSTPLMLGPEDNESSTSHSQPAFHFSEWAESSSASLHHASFKHVRRWANSRG